MLLHAGAIETPLPSLDDHVHADLSIVIEGQEVALPSDLGIGATGLQSFLHTHGDGNWLHIEPFGGQSPPELLTVGDYFDTWRTNAGIPGNNPDAVFNANQILDNVADANHVIRMFVNSEPITEYGDYQFRDEDEIVISFEALADVAAPSLLPIDDMTLLGGSPLHIPLNGFDPTGQDLAFTATSDNALVSTFIPEGNRSIRFDVTDFGTMVFELFEGRAPRVTEQIVQLAESGFYDGITFHRVIDGFVIQGGDPTGTGGGGSTLDDFDDQYHVDLQHNRTGILSMAKGGDDTNDSQFFVTEGATRLLDFNHSIFGQLVEGENVRQLISNVQTGAGDRPLNDVVMESVQIFVDNENGVLMLKAPEGASGVANITVTATDESGNTFERTFRVDVEPDTFNGTPFLDDIPEIHTTVNTPVTTQVSATDVEGDPIILVVTPSGVASFDIDIDEQTGEFTVTPPTDFVGTLEVEVSVAAETFADTVDQFDSQIVQVIVEPGVPPDAPLGVDLLAGSDSGIRNDDDRTNANPLEFEVSGVTPGAVVSLLVGDILWDQGTATGQIAILTSPDLSSFSDGLLTITAMQTLDNVESDRSPGLDLRFDTTLPPMMTSVASNTAAVGLPYVYDAENAEEGSLDFRYSLANPPSDMTIDANTGQVDWTPDASHVGSNSFDVLATDAAGNVRTQSISVEVMAGDFLSTTPDSYHVTEDETLTVDAVQGVLANDGGAMTGSLTASLVAPPAHGTVNFASDGSFSYEPDDNFSGLDSFAYTVTDGEQDSLDTTVTLNVDPVNDGPEATGDNYALDEDGTLVIDAAQGVLANDEDVDGDTLAATLVNEPTNGFVTLEADGSFSYTPFFNFFGTDQFTYRAGDGSLDSDLATVTVVVNPTNDPPLATEDSFSFLEDSGGSMLDVLDNDLTAPDEGEMLTITDVGPTSGNGTVTIESGGTSLAYTPAPDFFGTETFTYTIDDGNGSIDSTMVTIQVVPQDDPPTANDDEFHVNKNSGPQILDVLANDTILPDTNEMLAVVQVGLGSAGGLIEIIDLGNRIRYTPPLGFFGEETFSYILSDGDGEGDEATATITVTEFVPNDLSGTVYFDTNRSGFKDVAERTLGGVTVTLDGVDQSSEAVNLTTTTAADGSYEFLDLVPGDYTIRQVQPQFLRDGGDTIGNQGGDDSVDDQFTIELDQDVVGTGNNFGELGRKAQYVSIVDFLASTSHEAIMAATDTAAGPLWVSLGDGWDGFDSAEVVLSNDLATVQLTLVDDTDGVFTTTVPAAGNPQVHILGNEGDAYLLRIVGDSSQFDLQPTTTTASSEPATDAGEGEGETASIEVAPITIAPPVVEVNTFDTAVAQQLSQSLSSESAQDKIVLPVPTQQQASFTTPEEHDLALSDVSDEELKLLAWNLDQDLLEAATKDEPDPQASAADLVFDQAWWSEA